jgi:large subunit ribosomal protein L4
MAETIVMEAPAYAADGSARERVTLPAELFDGTVNMAVMHQAVKAYLANQRQGNASTKTRGLVVGGNRKPWRQKGTGRARQGSIRAPHWVGGGTVFGPQPRSYAEYVPKQVRALARRSAFNARAREGAIFVIDRFEDDTPSTSRLAALLARLELADAKVLILTDGVKRNVYLSGRNLPGVHVLPYSDVSAYHILWSDAVLMERPLVGRPVSTEAADESLAPESTASAPAAPETGHAGEAARGKPAGKRAAREKAAGKSSKTEGRATQRGAGSKRKGGGGQ